MASASRRVGAGPPDRMSGPIPTHRLRYEDLVAAPAVSIQTLAAWAGIELSDELGEQLQGAGAQLAMSHSVSGNPGRFDGGLVHLSEDVRWRSEMPFRQRALVTALTLPGLVAHGYVLSTAGLTQAADRVGPPTEQGSA